MAVVDRWLELDTALADVAWDLAVALTDLIIAKLIAHLSLTSRCCLEQLLLIKSLGASARAVSIRGVAIVTLEIVVDAGAWFSLDDGLVVLTVEARRILLSTNVGGLLTKVALVVGVVASIVRCPELVVRL